MDNPVDGVNNVVNRGAAQYQASVNASNQVQQAERVTQIVTADGRVSLNSRRQDLQRTVGPTKPQGKGPTQQEIAILAMTKRDLKPTTESKRQEPSQPRNKVVEVNLAPTPRASVSGPAVNPAGDLARVMRSGASSLKKTAQPRASVSAAPTSSSVSLTPARDSMSVSAAPAPAPKSSSVSFSSTPSKAPSTGFKSDAMSDEELQAYLASLAPAKEVVQSKVSKVSQEDEEFEAALRASLAASAAFKDHNVVKAEVSARLAIDNPKAESKQEQEDADAEVARLQAQLEALDALAAEPREAPQDNGSTVGSVASSVISGVGRLGSASVGLAGKAFSSLFGGRK